MPSALDTLIDVFGGVKLTQVDTDPDYTKLCATYDSSDLFHAQRNRVQRIRQKLEDEVGIHQTGQKQVKFALKLFHRLVGSDDQEDEICRRLTIRAYSGAWTVKQRAYYDDTCAVFRTHDDYFLSFTQRNPSTAGNPVNSRHRYLIQSTGLRDPLDSPKNELATMLDLYLRMSKYQFRGFFFPDHQGDSQSISQKLESACDQALVFIQLVQNEMFSKKYSGKKNYCHGEYRGALAREKPVVFLFADGDHPADFIPDDAVPFELDSWHCAVKVADCLTMAPTSVAEESANIVINRERLTKNLVGAVHRVRESLFERVPGDLD